MVLDQTARPGRDDDLGLRVATALVTFWHIRGYWSEGRRWLELLLRDTHTRDQRLRAKALNAAAWLAWDESDYGRASELSEEALSISRLLDDPWSVGWSAGRLSHARWMQGRYEEAADLAREAVACFRTLDAPWYVGWSLHQLGRVAHSAGDDDLAAGLFNESLASLQRAGDRGFATSFQYANLGDVAAARGDYAHAVELYEQALSPLRELGFKQGLIHTLHRLAGVWRKLGNAQRAVEDEREALTVCRDVGDLCGVARSFEGLALWAGTPERAIQLFSAGERLRRTVECPPLHQHDVETSGRVASLRASIPADVFERAWSTGAALGLAEVVQLALSSEADAHPGATARWDQAPAAE